MVKELTQCGAEVDVYDPWADVNQAGIEHTLTLIDAPKKYTYDGILLAVAHSKFLSKGSKEIRKFVKLQRFSI